MRRGGWSGAVALAAALILAWDHGARTLGPLFFAPPLEVLQRIGELARSGVMFTDIMATLRVSVLGFAIAAVAGVLLAQGCAEPVSDDSTPELREAS